MLIQAHLVLLELSLRATEGSAAISAFAPRLLRRPAKLGTPRNDTLVNECVLVKSCYPSAHVLGDKDDQAHNGYVLKDYPVNL